MTKLRIDRTSIFLGIVALLFFWDLIYILGIASPAQFPHPFRIFRLIGDSELFRGFRTMLRHIILMFVPGFVIGDAVGHFLVPHSRAYALLRFLRLGLWLPFLLMIVLPWFTVGILAVVLCSLYYSVAARMYLNLDGFEFLRYVGREALLQASFFCLFAQIWYGSWKWFEFPARLNAPEGWKVLAMLIALVFSINWFFRSNFTLTAQNREILLTHQLSDNNFKSLSGAILIVVACLIVWLVLAPLVEFRSSPLDVLKAASFLLSSGEIWNDIYVSLVEIGLGVLMGGALAFLVLVLISPAASVRNVVFQLLPLTYISPIVIWLLIFLLVLPGINLWILWHKVTAVGLLTFFPFIQSLWGLRNHRFSYRVLLAIDDSLPIAFVMMLFSELMAATAGLGFIMTVATATYQIDKALVGFFITAALLVAISSALRFSAKRLYMPGPGAKTVDAQAA